MGVTLQSDTRQKFKKIRNDLSPSYRMSASKKIASKIFQLLPVRKAKCIGVYMSRGSEVETLGMVEKMWSLDKRVAIPKVLNKNRLCFREIKTPGDWTLGRFGILEPRKTCLKVLPEAMDVILVPGLVFDQSGYRLGYGKGYYDRFLKKRETGLTIGVTYEKNRTSVLPHHAKDVPVACVVTEKKVYWIR